jgi:hypothetical protein
LKEICQQMIDQLNKNYLKKNNKQLFNWLKMATTKNISVFIEASKTITEKKQITD